MNYTIVDPKLTVGGQVQPHDVAKLAALGYKALINNRPDREEPGQPSSRELEAVARRSGLAYWHIPVVPGKATEANARAFADALQQADGPVFAFCRTGNRSTALWKMAGQLG